MNESVLQLESEIASYVNTDNKSNCTIHFEYGTETESKGTFNNPVHVASAFTVNPVSRETFLLKQEEGKTKEAALKKILEYVKNKLGQSSFTVLWMKKGDAKMNTSYFYCHDVLDVVEKFFHGKNIPDYTVHEIRLNPIA